MASRLLSFYFWNLFANHQEAYRSGIEAGKMVPVNLAEAFRDLLIKHNQEALYLNILSNDDVNELLKDPLVKFGVRYVNGLINVALEMVKEKHNGVLYLFDHIVRVLGNHELMPREGEVLTVEQW